MNVVVVDGAISPSVDPELNNSCLTEASDEAALSSDACELLLTLLLGTWG